MTNPKRQNHLSDLIWEEAKARAAENPTILFPAGSIEQHGPHLPVEPDLPRGGQVRVLPVAGYVSLGADWIATLR